MYFSANQNLSYKIKKNNYFNLYFKLSKNKLWIYELITFINNKFKYFNMKISLHNLF